MPCCGKVRCPYCREIVKKKLLQEHAAVCPSNPKNKESKKMSEERYHCTKCGRTHKTDSAIGKEHLEFKEMPLGPITEDSVSVEVETAPEEKPEPEVKGGIGRLAIGGVSGSPPTPPKRDVPVLQKEDRTFEALTNKLGSPELCKYIYWARDSCVSCQGHRCASAGDKKLDPGLVDEICRTTKHLECLYYAQAIETGTPQTCPYQGPPPADKVGCTGAWCYADNRNIRVPKTCKKFGVNCDVFARKKWAGVPFYRNLPMIGPEVQSEEEDTDLEEVLE